MRILAVVLLMYVLSALVEAQEKKVAERAGKLAGGGPKPAPRAEPAP